MASRVNTQLLAAAREACTELFALMLSEKAHRVRGRYTDSWEKLDKAIRAAEETLRKEREDSGP